MADDNYNNNDRQWHLDKRVPIMLIAALIMQSASMAWWASDLDARVQAHDRSLAQFSDYRERVIRLETYQESMLNELKGIRSDLRQLLREGREIEYGN